MIEEFLYVQSTEQIISIPVALRCVEALGIRRRKKNEGAGSEIKCFKVLILKSQLKLLRVLISEGDKTHYIAYGEGVPGGQIVNWPFLSTKQRCGNKDTEVYYHIH